MKGLLRVFVFTLLSLLIVQKLVNGFVFENGEISSFLLLVIALTLLNLTLAPIFKLIALPERGFGNLLLFFLITFATVYVLTLFIPSFTFTESTIGDLLIFGLVIPSKRLSVMATIVVSTMLFSIIYKLFSWLGSK